MEILVGADPEVFMMKNGNFVSAHGMIPGDKKNPFPVNKGAVQVDGMALEFNIDAAKTADEFCINVSDVLSTLKDMVKGYEVLAVPVADFSAEVMRAQPAEALELGCDPDYNGWTCQENEKPDGNRLFRTASGHVHIGWSNGMSKDEVFLQAAAVARQMDFFLGLPSLFWDDDLRRREMYGKGGCFRPKHYGCEYRTLSNAWLNSEKLMRLVFNNVQEGMKRLINGEQLSDSYGCIQEIIDTSNKKEAEKIMLSANITGV